MSDKFALIFGTRPEIIKMAPIIKLLKLRCLNYIDVHTGQHYSPDMDTVFFSDLDLAPSRYKFEGFREDHPRVRMRKIEEELIKVFEIERPDHILVYGDTNSTVAGAFSAQKLGITLSHIEAGLRSHNIEMVEELNRVAVDHISDHLFPPCENAKINLLMEKIPDERIFVSGNTIVDSLLANVDLTDQKSSIIDTLELQQKDYGVITLHRSELVDHPASLRKVMTMFEKLTIMYTFPWIFPMHPRTRKMCQKYDIGFPDKIRFLDPLGYMDFLSLEKDAKIVLTDSGGIQEETCVLRIPCVTLRNDTERPETIELGSNILCRDNFDDLPDQVALMLERKMDYESPYGDGKTSERIIDYLLAQPNSHNQHYYKIPISMTERAINHV